MRYPRNHSLVGSLSLIPAATGETGIGFPGSWKLESQMNRCVRSFSASCSSFAFTLVIAVLLLAASLGLAPPLQATAIAMGSVQVTNFTITPSTGTVVFTDLWTAQAFAEAQNSLCGCDSQFNSSLGGTAMADAMVMFAAGHSFAHAAALDLSAAATVNISGGIMAANAIGQATLFNTTFSITGGSGPVDVTFSAMLNIAQMLFTDASGVFAGTDASVSVVSGWTECFIHGLLQPGGAEFELER